MLRNIKTYLAALVLLVGASSCLDKFPQSAIAEKDAMKTFTDAEQVRTGAYALLKDGALYSGYLTLLPDIQCDLVHAVQGNTNKYGNYWRWDIRSNDTEIEGIYSMLYTVIGSCNFFLDQVDAVRGNTSEDEDFDLLDTYTGEMYALRALAYSELIKCFCKSYPYTPDADEEAKNMLGVVISTSYFKPGPARRASLYDSYQQVLDDLGKAEALLDEDEDEYSNEYLSAGAVQALRARVALYMGKWDDAITYSSKLIDRASSPYKLADSKTTYSTASDPIYTSGLSYYDYMLSNDVSFEIIWRVGFNITSYGSALGSVFQNFTSDYQYFYPDYVPSQTVLDTYSANDYRYTSFFRQVQTGYASGLTCPILIKYYGNRTFITNRIYQVSMPKPFRLSEQYLIRAEAYCWKGETSKGAKDLSTLRSYRFKSGYTITLDSNKDKWLTQISEERVRELYMEGFRLQDLKRWGRGFERKNQTQAQTEAATLKIDASNPLFVWPIPQHELEAPGSEVAPNESNK